MSAGYQGKTPKEFLVGGGEMAEQVNNFHPDPVLSGDRILLVDDNTDMRDYVSQLLLDQGYKVETAPDGVAALAAIGRQMPDLVLTDVMMPQLDGFGLLRELRAESRTREIPIILLSVCAEEEARVEGLEAGADDYLINPVSDRELLARVKANLRLAKLRREAGQREQVLRLEAERAKDHVETILSSISDGFLVLDDNWCCTYINDRQCEIIGMQRSALLGKNLWELFPDFVGTEVYVQFQRAMTEQTSVQFDDFYPTWNRHFEYQVYPSPDKLAIFVTEITERQKALRDRQQAEAALLLNEAKLKSLMEANVVGILFGDVYGGVHEANDELLRIIGYTREDLSSGKLSWIDITPPEYLGLDKLGIAEAEKTGACTPYEKEYIRKDGSRVPVLVGYTLLGEAREESVAFILDISDVYDELRLRKEAQKALAVANERFQHAAAAVNCLIYEWDIEQNTVERTEGLTQILGYSLNEANESVDWWFDLYHPDDKQRVQDEMLRAWTMGDRFSLEYRVRHKDGHYVHLLDQGIIVQRNADGKPIRQVGSTTDISHRKQAETEREQLLRQEQAARAEAERANRIKDEFLAVLSHELRSPLNPILGWAKLLQGGKLDATKTALAIATIERNAKLQSELIEDLLDVSRILQGKLNLDVHPVNLASIIQAALGTVQLAAQAKSIQVQVNLDAQVGEVSGDATRLQQVVWNLLSNAVKFTPPQGTVEVCLEQVGTEKSLSGGFLRTELQWAQIRVKDTGKGIAAEFLPYVFDYFRQEDGKTTRQFGGLGLGLAIVRHLVELHGGRVWVESPGEGLGATFTVRLPLRPMAAMVTSSDNLLEPSLNLKGVQVLVVDDDADTREFIVFLLEMAGARVMMAKTAGEALAVLTQFQPDVLLSDIGMPEMDGYMLIRQVRALPSKQGGQIPAIALTAYAGDFNQQQALEAGFQKHIAKPIEPDELIKTIATLVS
jgi:PAS domain S-box-containing protein